MKYLSFQIEMFHGMSHTSNHKPTHKYITEEIQNSGNKVISYKLVELGERKDFQQRIKNYHSYKFPIATNIP